MQGLFGKGEPLQMGGGLEGMANLMKTIQVLTTEIYMDCVVSCNLDYPTYKIDRHCSGVYQAKFTRFLNIVVLVNIIVATTFTTC
jgi:hypothetical protein